MLLVVGRLVGRAEIRTMFGVRKTQARNLTFEPDFPAPFDDTLSTGPVWLREEVAEWGRRHNRAIYGEDDHGVETP